MPTEAILNFTKNKTICTNFFIIIITVEFHNYIFKLNK